MGIVSDEGATTDRRDAGHLVATPIWTGPSLPCGGGGDGAVVGLVTPDEAPGESGESRVDSFPVGGPQSAVVNAFSPAPRLVETCRKEDGGASRQD